MTTLTIEIPDDEVKELASYIKQKGGKVRKTNSTGTLKKAQLASLERGLTEARLIGQGKMEGKPLSQLWDE